MDHGSASGGSSTDFKLGVAVAIVAALTAIVDLAAGRLSDDELVAVSERTSAYMWHQAKSIKEASAEGRALTLRALLDAGALKEADTAALEKSLAEFHADALRLANDKRAILDGGNVDGKPVIGARAWEERAQATSRAGDIVDAALLFLHLSLLLGGVGIASQSARLERLLLRVIVAGSALGVTLAVVGFVVWLSGVS